MGTVNLISDGSNLGLPDIGYDRWESFHKLAGMWRAEVQRRLDADGRGYVVAVCEITASAYERASMLKYSDGATNDDGNWDEADSINSLIENALEECAHEVDKWVTHCEVQVSLPEDDDDLNLSVEFFRDVYRHGFSPMPDGGFMASPLILYGEDAADFHRWCVGHRAWRCSPFGVPLLEFDNVCPPVMDHDDDDVRKFPRVVWGHAKR